MFHFIFWAELTFKTIGSALGDVKAVDIDARIVQVVIDGFKSLCFETYVEFHNGEEIPISLRYDRLFGFCRQCFSLCHEDKECPTLATGGGGDPPSDSESRAKMLSYKGAVENKKAPTNEGEKGWQYGKRQGNQTMMSLRFIDTILRIDLIGTEMVEGTEGKDHEAIGNMYSNHNFRIKMWLLTVAMSMLWVHIRVLNRLAKVI